MFYFFRKDKKPKNLKEVLKKLEELEEKIEGTSGELDKLERDSKFSIQKTGIVRFNPFSGVGGDQSFSVALLDGHNDGVVITSLFTREGNRIYAKPIKNGSSEYILSDEEKEAISKAIES